MKKVIGILAIALLLSCTPDEVVNNELDCNCSTVIMNTTWLQVDSNGANPQTFSQIDLRNDCTGNLTIGTANLAVGTKICN